MNRVLIVDDHAVVRGAIRATVEALGGEVCGEAGDGDQALKLAVSARPNLAIIDVMMPISGGVALTSRIRSACPEVKVVLFTMCDDEKTIEDVLRAGARGMVLKSEPAIELERAIRAVTANRPYFSPEISQRLLERTTSKFWRPLNGLSAREVEVVALIARGKTNREIADIMNISAKTVETHRASAMRKIDGRKSGDLVRFAVRNNLVEV